MVAMRLVMCLILLPLAGFAAAAELPPMAGVGVLVRDGKADCSAVLIAPDLVVTAAHCIAGKTLEAEGGDSQIQFRTGAYPGHQPFEQDAATLMPHPLYLTAKIAFNQPMSSDIALIGLAAPIPASVAMPIAWGRALGDETKALVASYPGGLGSRARERICPVTETSGSLVRLTCKVIPGESGGSVLRLTDSGPELTAIVIAASAPGVRPYAIAVQAEDRIRQLLTIHRPEILE